jgi:hypothetical protein
MKLMVLSVLFLVVSCGKTVNNTKYIEMEPRNEIESPIFEGYYALPDGGFADVFDDAQNLVSVRALRLLTVNSDDSTGIIPTGSLSAGVPVNGVIYHRTNLNYTVSQNIKKDVTNAPIIGNFLTEIRISKKDEKLLLTVIISDANSVLYKKTIESI